MAWLQVKSLIFLVKIIIILSWSQVEVKPRQVADLSDAGKHMGVHLDMWTLLGRKEIGAIGPQVDLINHIEQKQNH